MSYKLPLALIALAIVMLVGCHEPVGVPSDSHAATTQTLYITTDSLLNQTGHIDWYQGELTIWDYYTFNTYTITRAFDYYHTPTQPPLVDTSRAYPRKNGFCVFRIPPFDSPNGIPVCTLYYYQNSHSGSADLLVNAWFENIMWPPIYQGDRNTMFWAIWNSTDTVATDVTHANDDCWYKVPLSDWACQAIADSGATGDWTVFYTGWIYPSYMANHGQDGWYTDVSGADAIPPYIKVVYDDGE